MKRIFLLLFLSIIVCTTSAQAMFWPYMPWDDSYNDRYFIGSPPTLPPYITAIEYQAFLMQYAQDDGWEMDLQYYWDSKYMDPKSPDYCIIRSGMSYTHYDDSGVPDAQKTIYHYAVKAGCENKKISFVASAEVANEIASWRENPTIGEVLKYIGDMVQVDSLQQAGKPYDSFWNDAQQIKQRYPNITDIYSQEQDGNDPITTIFDHADKIAKTMLKSQPDFVYDTSFLARKYNLKLHHHFLSFTISNFYLSKTIYVSFPQEACPSYETMIGICREENEVWSEHARPNDVSTVWN